jgi:hypothetical protein
MTRRLRIVSFIAVLGCFALSGGSYYLGFELWPPSATMADGTKTPFRSVEMEVCLKERAVAWLGDRGADLYWRNCQRQLSQYRALDGLEVRFWTVIGFGLFGFAALIAFALSLRFYSPSSKVVRGARLHAGGRGLRAFAQACAGECRIHGEGIALVPSVPLSREREARHFLILGSVGGGKTQTMLHLIGEAIARRDGVLVLDTKGDMMGGLPALGEPLLVAPHDKRSLVWDIAADCSIEQDARELAARFIPPSSDPMWSQAAQEIFVACIVHLQATRGCDWGWADLEGVVTADVDRLTAYAKDHNPNALRLLYQPDCKTTMSILTTFQTHMRIVSVLAEAWSNPSAARFSIRAWLHNPVPYRPLILQHDPRLSRAVTDLDRQHARPSGVSSR